MTPIGQDRWKSSAWKRKLGPRARGDCASSLALLTQAADMEDATDKSNITPGAVLPAREQLADLQVEVNRPADALRNYEASLKNVPRRFNSLYGAARAAELTGDKEQARVFYGQFADLCRNADSDRPELQRAKMFLAQK
jgi:hypothetical protein